jgi:DnaK suppressor protein
MAANPEKSQQRENDVVPPAKAEQILGRPLDAAKRDPATVMARQQIDPKWKKYYQRLLEIRDGIIDEETRLMRQSRENQPEFIKDTPAEAASSSFTRDMALGRVSGYQELLDEVNHALRRIETGGYGICELTGKSISPERLQAVPWTRFSKEAEAQLESEGSPPVRFELPPQFTTGDASAGRTEAESTLHRDQNSSRT